MHNPKCWHNHTGPWLVLASWLNTMLSMVRAGTVPIRAQMPDGSGDPGPGYTLMNGVAVIDLAGPLMKFDSKFGGTNTVKARQAIRAAVADPQASSILLHVDSPGGSVAGTAELAADVKAADGVKPVHAHIDDLGASAAYWIASQARKITANAMAMVGSIGTLLVIEDTSKVMDAAGIKVHVLSTGPFKGAGTDGAPVTPDQLAYMQSLVDGMNAGFLTAVADGRQMDKKSLAAVADGRVWLAKEAKSLGLIDAVDSMDAVVGAMATKYAGRKGPRMARADTLIKLSEMS